VHTTDYGPSAAKAISSYFGTEGNNLLCTERIALQQPISGPIRRTVIFSLEIKKKWWMYFNFSNLLEENRIVTYQN
jgi:hypothetical protein